ncbi:MAG: hypothetical protein RML75_02170 [Cyanobacteriota bacterium SKYGB_h_bin112]|nr:hypothetical protein [Cyanobacteriota bacterium SKYGB_h_bin112]
MSKFYKPSQGFSVGLIWFLIYLFGFFFLGYGLVLPLMLATIGGLVTGLVVDWWMSKEEAVKAPPPTTVPIDTLPPPSSQVLRRRTVKTSLQRHANRDQPSRGLKLSRLRNPFGQG